MNPTKSRRRALVAAMLVTSVLASSATVPQAFAEPGEQGGTTAPGGEQGGEQGGTLTAPSGEQGGTTPAPAPEPAPVAPVYTPGPGLVPGPPPGDYQQPQEQQYPNYYSPSPQAPLQPRQDVAPIKRIAPKTDKRGKATEVRAGNYSIPVSALPRHPQRDRAVNSLNDWFAYGEATIATELVARGVPEDEASRQAAAAIAGAAAAGIVGGTVTFVGSTIVIGTVVIPVATLTGAGIGTAMMGPAGTGPGALTGLAVGTGITLAASGSLAVGAAILSALAGGGLGWALGAGDPGQTVDRPDLPWEQQRPGKHRAPEISDPSNQFVATAGPSSAPASYVVAESGDVSVSAQVGGQTVSIGWTAEQAAAPIKALGPAAPAAQRVVEDVTDTVTAALSSLPGTSVKWGTPKSGSQR